MALEGELRNNARPRRRAVSWMEKALKFLSRILVVASLVLAPALPVIAQGPPPHLPADILMEAVDEARVQYLAGNVVVDGPVTGGLKFEFPDAFYAGRLFLLGESHGSAAPQVLDLELLAHLNQRIGLSDYVAEVDPVQAMHLNDYLDNGDEGVLDRVFDLWNSGSQWASVAFEEKVRGIRALNQSLPVERRIRFHGLDAIQDWPLLVQSLQARDVDIDAGAMLAAKGSAARARIAADALQIAGEDPDAFLLAALRRQADGADREATIFGNYAHLVGTGPLLDRPAYGLWGLAHVLQDEVNATTYWAGRVRASSLSSASGLRSIVMYGLDSAAQFPVPLPTGVAWVRFADSNVDGPVVKLSGSASLRAASEPDRIRVFAIDGAQSPYRSGQQLVALRSSIDRGLTPSPDAVTTDFIQYVGVYRNSDWAVPREGSGPVLGP